MAAKHVVHRVPVQMLVSEVVWVLQHRCLVCEANMGVHGKAQASAEGSIREKEKSNERAASTGATVELATHGARSILTC